MKSFAPFIESSPRPKSSGPRPRLLLPLLLGAGLALRASEVAPDEVVQLPPVTVIATALASPGRLEIDPRAPAQPIPAQDGADLLRAAPGINIIRKGGIDGDPVLRGMAGSRLGVLLDDQLLLGGCGNRMDPPTAYVFPSAFDRVTLLKGPQSVLHGPGQSAGVVRFERKTRPFPAPDLDADASLTLGSFGRSDQSLTVLAGAPAGDLRVSGNHARADDYEDGEGRAVPSAYDRWGAEAALGWTPRETTRLELSGARSDGKAAYADRAMDGVKFARDNLALRLEHANAGAGALRHVSARAYRNYVDHVMDNYSLRPFAPTMMMPRPAVSNPDRETFGGRTQFTLHPSDDWHLELGLDAQANRHSVRFTGDQTATPYRSLPRREDARFDQLGVFAEVTRHLGETRRVVAGARLDDWRAEDVRETVALGMMGAAPNPTAQARRHETLGSGFVRYEAERGPATAFVGAGYTERFPDYWELFSKESAASLSAFETEVEKTAQIDAGLLYRQGRVNGSISAFASHVDDFVLIESDVAKPAGMGVRRATIARNVEAATFGGEATLGVGLGDAWSIETSLAYVRGRNLSDALPLAQQPPLEARLHLRYASGPWSAGALLRLVAEQDRFARNQGNIVGQDIDASDAFAVLSLHASRRLNDRARLSVGVDNLWDATYAEHLSRGGAMVAGFPPPDTRINEPGRTFWLKLDLRY